MTFEEALKEAQDKGITETNPILDISGSDSACKLLLLTNSLMETEKTLTDIHIKGIEHVTKQQIRNAKEQHKIIKLIASTYKDEGGNVNLNVEPCEIEKDHPLAKVNGTEKELRSLQIRWDKLLQLVGLLIHEARTAALKRCN